LTLALCAALGVAGCGGDDDSSSNQPASTPAATATATATQESSSSGGGGETVSFAADTSGALKFQQTEVTAKAGKATISFENESQVPHAVEIEGVSGAKTKTVTGGKTSVNVDLKPGKYTFYCPVPGHREAGMVGTLTVN
jgi:plastocyanin